MAKDRNKSPLNDKMLEADGDSAIVGPPPGTANRADIELEDLGKLSEFPTPMHSVHPEEGTGEYVVVLADFLSGSGENTFVKGDVRRLSNIIQGYDDPRTDREVIKGRIKRFFDMKAIRLATAEEAGRDKVQVTLESESESVQNERNRRIAAENENRILRERLGLASEAQAAASPNAGASGQAQQATTEANEAVVVNEWEEGKNDWE